MIARVPVCMMFDCSTLYVGHGLSEFGCKAIPPVACT